MRQSAIIPAANAGQAAHTDVGINYPFSAQYKGDGWYIFNAATNEFGCRKFPTAASAELAIEEARSNG